MIYVQYATLLNVDEWSQPLELRNFKRSCLNKSLEMANTIALDFGYIQTAFRYFVGFKETIHSKVKTRYHLSRRQ